MLKKIGNKIRLKLKQKKASTLATTVSVVALLAIFSAGMSALIVNEMLMIIHYQDSTRAYYLAEAGVNHALRDLNNNGSGNTGSEANPIQLGTGSYYTEYNAASGVLQSFGEVGNTERRISVKVSPGQDTFTENFDNPTTRSSATTDPELDWNLQDSELRLNAGGYSWVRIVAPSAYGPGGTRTVGDLANIYFVNDMVAWAVGVTGAFGIPGPILKTTDGGETWEYKSLSLDKTKNNFTDVFFFDENNGWVAGVDRLYRTTNGGNSWQEIDIGWTTLKNGGIQCIYFADSNNGWIAGGNNSPRQGLFKTTNGGNNWSPQNLPYPYNSWPISSLSFVSKTTGWATAGNQIFKTSNDGSSWSPQNPPDQWRYYDTHFIYDPTTSNYIGWAAGYWGLIAKTENGGADGWNKGTKVSNISDDCIHDVFFIDQNTGWAVGRVYTSTGGVIYRTTDGGSTWSQEHSLSDFNTALNSIYFTDENHGWAVGNGATILKYAPRYYPVGAAQSAEIDNTNRNITSATLRARYNRLPQDTFVRYYLSADNGTNWVDWREDGPINGDGQSHTFNFASQGSQLIWRAELYSNDPTRDRTPQIDQINITYRFGATLDYSAWRSN